MLTESRTGWLPGNARSNRATLVLGMSLVEVAAPYQWSEKLFFSLPGRMEAIILENSFDWVFSCACISIPTVNSQPRLQASSVSFFSLFRALRALASSLSCFRSGTGLCESAAAAAEVWRHRMEWRDEVWAALRAEVLSCWSPSGRHREQRR